MDEDEEMKRALAMSMDTGEGEDGGAAGEGEELDPAFLQSVLQGLDPDVDPDAVKKDLEKKD